MNKGKQKIQTHIALSKKCTEGANKENHDITALLQTSGDWDDKGKESKLAKDVDSEVTLEKNIIDKEVDMTDELVDNACEDILADLTPCDVRVLVRAEEELTQCHNFERVFPTSNTGRYLQVLPPLLHLSC